MKHHSIASHASSHTLIVSPSHAYSLLAYFFLSVKPQRCMTFLSLWNASTLSDIHILCQNTQGLLIRWTCSIMWNVHLFSQIGHYLVLERISCPHTFIYFDLFTLLSSHAWMQYKSCLHSYKLTSMSHTKLTRWVQSSKIAIKENSTRPKVQGILKLPCTGRILIAVTSCI